MAKEKAVVIKRDSRKNWEKSKYIPNENVIVIMDNTDGSISLMLGDGETNVNFLPDLLKVKGIKSFSSAIVDEDVLVL